MSRKLARGTEEMVRRWLAREMFRRWWPRGKRRVRGEGRWWERRGDVGLGGGEKEGEGENKGVLDKS